MRDWSGALVDAERHQRKAEQALTMLRAGLNPSYSRPLVDQAEEHLTEQLKAVMDALMWVRSLRA